MNQTDIELFPHVNKLELSRHNSNCRNIFQCKVILEMPILYIHKHGNNPYFTWWELLLCRHKQVCTIFPKLKIAYYATYELVAMNMLYLK